MGQMGQMGHEFQKLSPSPPYKGNFLKNASHPSHLSHREDEREGDAGERSSLCK